MLIRVILLFSVFVSTQLLGKDLVLDAKQINQACLSQVSVVYAENGESLGVIKCVHDEVTISANASNKVVMTGSFDRSMHIVAKDVEFRDGRVSSEGTQAVQLRVQAENLLFRGKTNVVESLQAEVASFESYSKLALGEIELKAEKVIVQSQILASRVVMKAAEVLIKRTATLSAANSIRIDGFSNLINRGHIAAKNYLLITGNTVYNEAQGIIYSEGALRYQLNSLVDNGITVALKGASYQIENEAILNTGKFIGGEFFLNALNLYAEAGYQFELFFGLMIGAKQNGYVSINAKIEQKNNYKKAQTKYRGLLQTSFWSEKSYLKSSNHLALADQGLDSFELDGSRDVVITSPDKLDAKRLIVRTDGSLSLRGQYIDFQGLASSINGVNNLILIQGEQAVVDARLQSDDQILIDLSKKINLAGKVMANELINIASDQLVVAGYLQGKEVFLTAEELIQLRSTAHLNASGKLTLWSPTGEVIIDDGAIVDAINLNIHAGRIISGGNLSADNMSIESEVLIQNGVVEVKNATIITDNWTIGGRVSFDALYIKSIEQSQAGLISSLTVAPDASLKVGDSYTIQADGSITNSFEVDQLNVAGALESVGNLILGVNRSTVSGKVVGQKNIKFTVGENFVVAPEGEFDSTGNIFLELKNNDYSEIQGAIKSQGWVGVSGEFSSEDAINLLAGVDGNIDASEIKVFTTEPIVIEKNLHFDYGVGITAPEVTIGSNTRINAADINLTSSKGDLVLMAGSDLQARNSVRIYAAGDLRRNSALVASGAAAWANQSRISAGEGGITLSTDGSYIETAAITQTPGKLIIGADKNIVIVPLVNQYTVTHTDKNWFRTKTRTQFFTTYFNSQVNAGEIELHFNGDAQLVNWTGADYSKVAFRYTDGSKIDIQTLQNEMHEVVTRTGRGIFKPVDGALNFVNDLAQKAKKLTSELIGESFDFLRQVNKEVLNNQKWVDEYLGHFETAANGSAGFMIDLQNPKKSYKVSTYRGLYNSYKQGFDAYLEDMDKLTGEVYGEVNEHFLSKVSGDLAKTLEKFDRLDTQVVGHVQAATEFDNVARVALVAVASTMGAGAGGVLVANLLADKFISKKKITADGILKSAAIAAISSYAGSALSDYDATARAIGEALVRDAAEVVIEGRSYKTSDLLVSILQALASTELPAGNNVDMDVWTAQVIRGAVNAGIDQVTTSVVDDGRLDLEDTLNAMSEGAVYAGVDASISNSSLVQIAAEKLAGFGQAMAELITQYSKEELALYEYNLNEMSEEETADYFEKLFANQAEMDAALAELLDKSDWLLANYSDIQKNSLIQSLIKNPGASKKLFELLLQRDPAFAAIIQHLDQSPSEGNELKKTAILAEAIQKYAYHNGALKLSYAESAWDMLSFAQSTDAIMSWNNKTSIYRKMADVLAIGVDGVALALPIIPGGAGPLVELLSRTPEVVQNSIMLFKATIKEFGPKVTTEIYEVARKSGLFSGGKFQELVGHQSSYETVKSFFRTLGKSNIPLGVKKSLVKSFELQTIKKEIVNTDIFVYRWHNNDDMAREFGRFVSDTPIFDKETARKLLALPNDNKMLHLSKFKIKRGTEIYRGKVAPLNGHTGGGSQIFITGEVIEDILIPILD